MKAVPKNGEILYQSYRGDSCDEQISKINQFFVDFDNTHFQGLKWYDSISDILPQYESSIWD